MAKSNESANRVAFSPTEFASLFGKSQTWGYRQIYAGKVKAITDHGRVMIPASEVESILRTAGVYEGKQPMPSSKEDIHEMTPSLRTAWEAFLESRRKGAGAADPSPKAGGKALMHRAAINRMTGRV